MGYVAIPFAVDLAKAREALGSKDLVLLEKIKTCALYDDYASQTGDCDFNQIVEDLIIRYLKPADRKIIGGFLGLFKDKSSTGLNPGWAHHYGYAMLTICDTLGTFLSPEGDNFYAGQSWNEVNKILKNKRIAIDLDKMWKTEMLFDIPSIPDFPVISHYSKQEVSYLLTELKQIEIDDSKADSNNSDLDKLHQLLKTFRDGLQICKDKDVEWVSFLH